MEALEIFISFVKSTLVPEKARRYAEIAKTKKGKQKILNCLNHEFESAVQPDCFREGSYDNLWEHPCFIFHNREFGVPCDTVKEAYNKLATKDGWLIILGNRTAAIYRPEARWDAEKLIMWAS